jgi:LuxR family maltose regulon positive regulatory protein
LLRTKLHRPPITADLVPRPRLLERLDQHRDRPLTLVLASAGYGKTTLVSSWLETCDCPNAWLSLDANDNDLALFLSYFLAAVQTMFPDAGEDTLALLKAATPPPIPVLARSLINELDRIEQPFILVLDDCHHIREVAVHDLLNDLLRHPPRALHLVLASREDPLLSLITLRARGQVTEIRAPELRFTESETVAFLEQQTGTPADDGTISTLMERLGGWVTGLRLLTLSLRHRGGAHLTPDHLRGSVSYITDYLVAEVLEGQPRVIRDWLLCTSILDRFCAPVCEAVSFGLTERPSGFEETTVGSDSLQAHAAGSQSELDGGEFLERLETANLFVTRLDDVGEWYHYHPLFQELLQGQLKKRLDAGGVAALHRRASTWYAQNGYLEEALHHALDAGDTSAAVDLVVQHRHESLNQERFHVLERWLNLLPREAVEDNAELNLTEAWLLDYGLRHEEIPPLLERVAILLGDDAALTEQDRTVLGGEIAVLQGILFYWMGQGQLSLENTRHAVEVTPTEHEWVRGVALTFRAGAYQLVGQLDKAYEEIHKILAAGSGGGSAFNHRAYDALLGIESLAGNLSGLEQTAQRQVDLTEPRRLYDSLGWALYGLGTAHYLRNDLAKAKQAYTQVVDMRHRTHASAVAQGYYGLALTFQGLGKPDQARETSQTALGWAAETGNAFVLVEAHSFVARLALLQGQVPDTSQWAAPLGDEIPLMLMLQIPHLTLANVLLAQGTPDALQKAGDLMARLRQSAEATYNTWRTMEITAMQAVLKETEGEQQAALDLLEPVLVWAEPRGFIRLFADLGPRMAGLLERLYRQGVASEYITQILASFATKDQGRMTEALPSSTVHRHSSFVIEPLTNRELDVLELMAQRLTNKEIAAQLIISSGTVKLHAHNIYQKLDVNGRRQAVAKATALGILSSGSVRR